MKRLAALLVTLLVTLYAACALAAQPIEVTDMYGRSITLDEPARRIVALSAADCEILCALGCEDALVGRGTYCDYPASIQDVPVVESGAETNVEQIIALQPQVVLMSDMAQSVDGVNALENAGIRVVVSNADSIEGVYTAIGMIGQLMDRSAEAEKLIGSMKDTFADVAARSKAEGKTVYFEVSPLQWGLWTAGTNTFMDELAAMCGLKNAFADVQGWADISEEQVLLRDPDYIVTITMYYGEGPTPVEEIVSRPGWENLKAVSQQQVFNVDSDSVSRPGPRLMDAALELFQLINAKEK